MHTKRVWRTNRLAYRRHDFTSGSHLAGRVLRIRSARVCAIVYLCRAPIEQNETYRGNDTDNAPKSKKKEKTVDDGNGRMHGESEK